MLGTVLFVVFASLAQSPQQPAFIVPSFHDVTIKVRQTNGLMSPQVTTWYLKGSRQRAEHGSENAPPQMLPMLATITQCDEHRTIQLNIHQKNYRSFDLIFPPHGRPEYSAAKGSPRPSGPGVLVTIHSVDTGDRRQVAGYQARRFKTTIKIEPRNGASTKPGKAKADSWYLDVPGMNCQDNNPRILGSLLFGLLAPHQYGHREYPVYRYEGVEPSGLLIEEDAVQRSAGNVIRIKVEMLEASDQALDESLFEIPADFVPAPALANRLVAPAVAPIENK